MSKNNFNEAYFSVYGNDIKRNKSYMDEYQRINKLISSGRILDVGCGLGCFLSLFPSKNWDKYGVDISDVAIQESRKKGIKVNNYSEAYNYPYEYFDVIVFRGSLQLLTNPFTTIETCTKLLNPGGYIIFLSTPNSNSPYYRKFKTLPAISSSTTKKFLIPSDVMLVDILKNYNFNIIDVNYPYIKGHYVNILKDHFYYLLSFLGAKKQFPFWFSMMEVYAQKTKDPC